MVRQAILRHPRRLVNGGPEIARETLRMSGAVDAPAADAARGGGWGGAGSLPSFEKGGLGSCIGVKTFTAEKGGRNRPSSVCTVREPPLRTCPGLARVGSRTLRPRDSPGPSRRPSNTPAGG